MDFLACPRCLTPLDGLRCSACRVEFPILDGVLCAFAEPDGAIADWRNRWRLERQRLDAQARAARQSPTLDASRARLDHLADASDAQRQHLEALLQPMLGDDRGGARETLLALKTRLPSHHAPASYNANVCRDWVWGREETAQAASILREIGPPKGRTLVIGCGAGGLTHALAPGCTEIVGVDSNPLLSFLAHRLNRGDQLPFVEFPTSPRTVEQTAVHHTLEAPDTYDNLSFVWADALRLPFAADTFDTVITHWLVDVIDVPFDVITRAVNRVLKGGGQWLNQGSFTFTGADPRMHLQPDEAAEAIGSAGFDAISMRNDTLPYLCTPHSRQSRTEEILTWSAVKTSATTQASRDHRPDWLTGGRTPVPLSQSFQTQAATTRIHAFVMSLIDGKRSLSDIGQELERQGLMPAREGTEAIRGMLDTMWEESQR